MPAKKAPARKVPDSGHADVVPAAPAATDPGDREVPRIRSLAARRAVFDAVRGRESRPLDL